jgi:hypothetical protein
MADTGVSKIRLQFMKFCCLTLKVGTWYAVSAYKITGPVCFEEALNSDYYVQFILTQFVMDFAKGEEMYGYFVQDSALAHVTNFSVTVPEGM